MTGWVLYKRFLKRESSWDIIISSVINLLHLSVKEIFFFFWWQKKQNHFFCNQKKQKLILAFMSFTPLRQARLAQVSSRKGLPGRCTSNMAMMEITCLLHAPKTWSPDFRASYGLVSLGMIYHPQVVALKPLFGSCRSFSLGIFQS